MRESKIGIDRIYDRISFVDNNSERRNYSDLHDELRIEIENYNFHSYITSIHNKF
jgi:hypothetical protein